MGIASENPLPFFGLEFLSQCKIVTPNEIEPMKVICNHHNHSQLHLYIVVGQVRVTIVVVVVSSMHFIPHYPSNLEPKKVNHNCQLRKRWSCVNAKRLSIILSIWILACLYGALQRLNLVSMVRLLADLFFLVWLFSILGRLKKLSRMGGSPASTPTMWSLMTTLRKLQSCLAGIQVMEITKTIMR